MKGLTVCISINYSGSFIVDVVSRVVVHGLLVLLVLLFLVLMDLLLLLLMDMLLLLLMDMFNLLLVRVIILLLMRVVGGATVGRLRGLVDEGGDSVFGLLKVASQVLVGIDEIFVGLREAFHLVLELGSELLGLLELLSEGVNALVQGVDFVLVSLAAALGLA